VFVRFLDCKPLNVNIFASAKIKYVPYIGSGPYWYTNCFVIIFREEALLTTVIEFASYSLFNMALSEATGSSAFPPGIPLGQLIYTFSWCYRRQYYSILLLHRVFRVPQAHQVRSKDRLKHATTTHDDAIPSSKILQDPLQPCIKSKTRVLLSGSGRYGERACFAANSEGLSRGPTDSTTLLPYAQKRTLFVGDTCAIYLIIVVGGRSLTATLEGGIRRLVLLR
jgi:hypothetical protein